MTYKIDLEHNCLRVEDDDFGLSKDTINIYEWVRELYSKFGDRKDIFKCLQYMADKGYTFDNLDEFKKISYTLCKSYGFDLPEVKQENNRKWRLSHSRNAFNFVELTDEIASVLFDEKDDYDQLLSSEYYDYVFSKIIKPFLTRASQKEIDDYIFRDRKRIPNSLKLDISRKKEFIKKALEEEFGPTNI